MKQQRPNVFRPSRLFIYYNERAIERSVRSDNGAQIRTGLHGVANGGTGVQALAKGVLTLGAPRAAGRALPVDYRSWVGTGGARSMASGRSASVRFLLSSEIVSRFRPRQATDGRPVPHRELAGRVDGARLARHGGVTPDRAPPPR